MLTTIPLHIRHLGLCDYTQTWQAMRDYTDTRDENSPDEIWLLQHPPVFTQGQNGKAEHILDAGDIPIVQVDRGGQVTYHGPGQLVAYILIDLKRRKIGVRQLVTAIEHAIIDTLAEWGIHAASRTDAPGVYVDGAKIASLGLRVRKNRTYHGLAFNIAMDMEPFQRINPCGLFGIRMIQLRDFVDAITFDAAAEKLVQHLEQRLQNAGVTVPTRTGIQSD
jgi:lipoyl(octanoyl) transferase